MAILFDTSYLRQDKEHRARHGMLWRDEELYSLQSYFARGYSLAEMCAQMQRPAAGILPKLCSLRLLQYSTTQNEYYLTQKGRSVQAPGLAARCYYDPASPSPFPELARHELANCPRNPKKEITMYHTKPITITSKTLINGEDISRLSDSELYAIIAEQEGKVKELNAIEHKPKRLLTEIERRLAGIEALVEYMNSEG